jgi:hypothetical protein
MAYLAQSEVPRCQVLFPMFGSPRGNVSLGRIGSGLEVGRIVVLREVPEETLLRVAPAIERAKSLTHPHLLKVLGIVSDDVRSYIASEYILGVSLSELLAQARARQRGMETGAAVRVIIDALRAAASARKLLLEAGAPPVRLLRGECVWLVDYGGTLLAEAGVSALLTAGAAPTIQDDPRDPEARDMMSAAVELYQLASGRLMTGDLTRAVRLHLPSRLANLLEGVFTWVPSERFDGVDGLANALEGLPPALSGSESLVASELRRLCAELLDERRSKLATLLDGPRMDVEGPTRVYATAPPEIEEDAEEPTVALPGFTRGRTVEPIMPPESATPAHVMAEPPPRPVARQRSSSRASRHEVRRGTSRRMLSELVVRERRMVLFFALLVLVVAIAWLRPDWFRNAAAKLGDLSASPATHDRGER